MNLNSVKKWFTDKDKKADEDLYIRVLLWAHEKQETGFTWENLKEHFSLDSSQESWVRKIFLTTSDQDRKFLEHLRNDETVTPNQQYYSLNEKGITAAINYKSLAHAEKTSNLAIRFAGISVLIAVIGSGFQILSTMLTRDSLNLSKEILQREQDPLIQYQYMNGWFHVGGNDNVIIKKVDWILVPNPVKINEGNDLSLLNLKNSLLFHIGEGKEVKYIKNFIDCYLFGSEFYRGIPLVVTVEFRRQGSVDTFTQTDLVRIRGSEREGLYIYPEKSGIGTSDVDSYIQDANKDMNAYKDILKDYNMEGKCNIWFGTPPKELW